MKRHRQVELPGGVNATRLRLCGSSVCQVRDQSKGVTRDCSKEHWEVSARQNKGITVNPSDNELDCFVDADFVSTLTGTGPAPTRTQLQQEPRTGYIIAYAGCPVMWAPRLQREVALSTTEAGYNALSEGLGTSYISCNCWTGHRAC